MNSSRVERFARRLPQAKTDAVRSASALKTTQRREALAASFMGREDEAREFAARVKAGVLDDLKALLLRFEEKCVQKGVRVHWAATAESARKTILEIAASVAPKGSTVVKGKSMATEEIHLNGALEEAGYRVVETDLGEFVVQIDGDAPSHIVTPIIHKDRFEIARSFEREGLGEYTEQPEALTAQARAFLRERFREAKVGISGVNFAIAETGRIVIVENEGNNRLSTTAPDVHIAVMGIEKLLRTEQELPVFLKLLACSATGQRVTTYVHFVSGPRRQDEEDGPREVHVVLLDNGRSQILGGRYRDILRCIRCGACLNVCPVYRQASGHGYAHVYGGPLGAVLAPALEGVAAMGDLSKASSLCGACEEVCPVRIPIPHMLLRLRAEAAKSGAFGDGIPWRRFAAAASSPLKWRLALWLLPIALRMPSPFRRAWGEFRSAPRRSGRSFRRWWRGRS